MKFLIVDDSSTMRRIITNSLRRMGYGSFVEAVDGDKALSKFDASVDCIISDWTMQTINGLQLAAAVRAHPDGASVPIMMIATRTTVPDILAAGEAGANAYLLKPFDLDTFRKKLTQLLATSRVAA